MTVETDFIGRGRKKRRGRRGRRGRRLDRLYSHVDRGRAFPNRKVE
jgi:hypothetical protein